MTRTTHNAGFSLVEVMVAILILGIALVGLTNGLTTALGSSKESEQQTAAALFAAGQIESLRASGLLEDETIEGDCGDALPLYRWSQTVTPTDTDGLHEVTVVVSSAQSGQDIYELKTLLFEPPEQPAANSDKSKTNQRGGNRS